MSFELNDTESPENTVPDFNLNVVQLMTSHVTIVTARRTLSVYVHDTSMQTKVVRLFLNKTIYVARNDNTF